MDTARYIRSMSESPATLDFLAEQQARILAELANMRADHAVLLAIVQRMDATMGGLLGEVRALHGQIGRFAHRVERLEGAAKPGARAD